MRRLHLLSLLFLPLSAFAAEATGHWAGSIKIPISPLTIQVDLKEEAREGNEVATLSGTIDIPAQSLKGFALGEVKLEGEALSFTMPKVGGEPKFAGKFKDHDHIEGTFTQRGLSFPFALERKEKPAPRLPAPPFPYDSEEVEIPTSGDHTLAGTLTLPKERKTPLTAVILLTGSGPQDRDEALMGQRPFLVLADSLTRAGIAVLRCDDRGVGKSTGQFRGATFSDFAADALAQLTWLKTRREIDPRRIGFAGHSEGGYIAPLAASRNPDDVAFLVLLAAPGIPMEKILVQQGKDIAKAGGANLVQIAAGVFAQQQLFDLLKKTPDDAAAEKAVRERVASQIAGLTPEARAAQGLTDAALEAQIQQAIDPAVRQMLACDPAVALREIRCPVLALNGEKDLQVSAKENLEGIRVAIPGAETFELLGLNHLFQHCKTGSPAEYAEIEETFAPEAMEKIAAWILSQKAR